MHNAAIQSERMNLLDLLDRLLETGVVVDGEIDLSIADINLVHLGLKLVLASSTTLERRNHGGVTHFANPADIPPSGSPGECSLGVSICPELPVVPRAESKAVAHVWPEATAETRLPFLRARACPPAMAWEQARPRIDSVHAHRAPERSGRASIDPAKVERGLAKLVLTLVELIRRLMERQAIRKMESGTLTEMQVEGLGEALRRLEAKMGELKRVFGLGDEELNLDLGPLGTLM